MIINELDNVEVLLHETDGIPAGHKRALCDITQGENVIKYGNPIGHATRHISKGEWVSDKNIATNLSSTLEYMPPRQYPAIDATTKENKSAENHFMGYRRSIPSCESHTQKSTSSTSLPQEGQGNGYSYGIRNDIWIIPTVGCIASLAQRLAHDFQCETNYPTRAFAHTFGCSQLGCDHEQTRQILCDLITHPNAGGVLVLGLGCENNQMSTLQSMLVGKIDATRVRFLEAQKVQDEYAEGMHLLHEIHNTVSQDKRVACPISELRIGLKCGGSDGFSGITANPLLGRLSDTLIAQGATTILTEVPEMFGAEHLLMERSCNKDTFEKTVRLINDFKQYYLSHDLPVGENPSPGNKAGGISTLEEKSLGCVQKGGSAPVMDVLDYGETLHTKGLNLLCAPGNDLVASTALAASGCQIVLFTTGRGTPFGTCVPTLKISTNNELAAQKPHWIDFNAGCLLDGTSWEEATHQLLQCVLDTANGAPSRNEQNGYSEIAIWKNGVTL